VARPPADDPPPAGATVVSLAIIEELAEEAIPVQEEVSSQREVFGLLVAHGRDAAVRVLVDGGFRVGEHNRRVRRDEELRAASLDEVVDAREEHELLARGERGLGLVQDVET
jgi:hypothetical protein